MPVNLPTNHEIKEIHQQILISQWFQRLIWFVNFLFHSPDYKPFKDSLVISVMNTCYHNTSIANDSVKNFPPHTPSLWLETLPQSSLYNISKMTRTTSRYGLLKVKSGLENRSNLYVGGKDHLSVKATDQLHFAWFLNKARIGGGAHVDIL